MPLPQWIFDDYRCKCENRTWTENGWAYALSVACPECVKRAEEVRHHYGEIERKADLKTVQLALGFEVDRVVEAAAPPPASGLPRLP